MKNINLMLATMAFLLLGMSECQKEQINATQVNLSKCDLASKFDFLKTITNEEGIVEEYVINPKGAKIVTYVVKYQYVPTGYLAICNLPDKFKQVGTRFKFSANVYQPKDMDLINLNAVPTELTSVQNVTPGN